MSYRRQIRYKQMRDAQIYGGNYGANVDKEGRSWLQQQVAANPNFVQESDQSKWSWDAFMATEKGQNWYEKKYGEAPYQKPAGYTQQQERSLPSVNDLPQPGVTVNAMPAGYNVGDNGLLLKAPVSTGLVTKKQYGTAWLNGDPSQAAQAESKPMFANVDQVKAGQAGWADTQVADRKALLSDPKFYKNNEITKYDQATQQEILKDPNFDWTQVPKWQKVYYDFSSSPTNIGPVSISGGVKMGVAQGLVMGAGNPGGAIVGGAIGAAGEWAGYDQNKEAWQQGDNKWTGLTDPQQWKDIGKGILGWLNYAAEQGEKAVGFAAQVANAASDPNKNVDDLMNKETWNAGASFYEVIAPAIAEAQKGNGKLGIEDTARLMPALFETGVLLDLVRHPEKYKGEERYLGASMPEELKQSWIERLDTARGEIASGRDYREVMTEMQTGLMAQMGDMVGQAVADPMNVMGAAQSKVGQGISKVTGNKVAEAAFTGTEGFTEAKNKYKNLVQTGTYQTIDPNFKPENMSWLSKQIAGVTTDIHGNVTNKAGSLFGTSKAGLLDPIKADEYVSGPVKSWKDVGGFVKMLASESPQSRAETGAVLFKDNVVAMLGMFDNSREGVREFGKYLKALGSNDMDTWSQLGGKFANSPEFYTVLPALKDANVNVIDGIIQMMDLTETNSDYLKTIADISGDAKGKLIDDIAHRGTTEQDYRRIVEKAKTSTDPKAKALLADVEAGKFTPDTLKQIVDVFTGDGALPRTPEHWKALIGAELSDHYGEWAAKNFQLDKSPEAKSAFFRTMGVLKTAQSILLLGGSPGYAIQNGLSGMVHLAASGVYGMMMPKTIDNLITRMGVSPARMDEGVGIGGVVDNSTSLSAKGGGAIRDALKGNKGALRTTKETLGKISSGMPMSKLSSWFEKLNSKQAFAQGMRSMWSQSWRRGVGFSRMTPALIGTMKDMGINPEHVYAAIEAGMNQGEIEKALYGRYEGVQSRSLIHEAAQRTGQSASQASEMLEKLGVMDQLDNYLKGQTTVDGVNAAFDKATRVAKDQIDIRMGEDLARKADAVKQRIGLEGAASGLDVVQRAHSNFTDVWMDHYFKLGDVFENLQNIPDEKMKSRAIEEAYRQSDAEFLRMYANNGASYKGIFDAWGMSGNPDALSVLRSMGDGQAAMKTAYDTMRELRKAHFETNWGGDIDAMFNNWDKVSYQIDSAFKVAFDQKARADVKMGESLSKIYENLYGNKAVGEAARAWWEQVVKMNAEITSKERKARQDFAKLPKAQREIAKKKYYGETKVLQIAELEKINQEGIARLEKVIKGSGESGASGMTPTDTPPAPSPVGSEQLPVGGEQLAVGSDAAKVQVIAEAEAAKKAQYKSNVDEFKEAQAQAEQRTATEQAEKSQRIAAVWDVAEGYWGKGGNYSRGILQDKFKLLGALRDESLGGFKDLDGLQDTRLTPDVVARVLDAEELRQQVKVEAEAPQVTTKGMRIGDNTTLLKAIAEHGGLAWDTARDLLGDKKPRTMPGTFTTKGVNMDLMARMLADDGYPIDINSPDDPGGVMQATELLSRSIAGDKIFPMSHDFDAANKAAELKYASEMMGETITPDQKAMVEEMTGEPMFERQVWEDAVSKAAAGDDLLAVYEAIDLPAEMYDRPMFEGGEMYREFIDRVTKAAEDANEIRNRDEAIAEQQTDAELAVEKQATRANAVMTRKTLEEMFTESFGDDPKVQTYMTVFDAVVGTFAKLTGEDVDAFTARFYADVMRSSEADFIDGLQQAYNRIEVAERTMTPADAENYARMLVRGGEGELRRAIQNEPNKADRIAILDAAHTLDAEMAQKVARGEMDILFQQAWHGSPHKFDKFTLDHIGSGEGAQAYGWGLYFAGDKAVAEFYRHGLTADKEITKINKELSRVSGEMDKARRLPLEEMKKFKLSKLDEEYTALLAERDSVRKDEKKFGQLYNVEIPDDGYLLWDAPLSEQSQAVKDAVKNMQDDYINRADYKRASELIRLYDSKEYSQKTGKEIYEKLISDFQQGKLSPLQRTSSGGIKGDQNASLFLKEAGISGIQYLDGSSRRAGEGNYNYVIFDDAAIEVKETYYQQEQASAKGAVTFEAETMRAIIHAFEAADVTTLVHENAHVFMNMLKDVAQKTNNPQVVKDLATIMDHVRAEQVGDGQWKAVNAEHRITERDGQFTYQGPTEGDTQVFDSFEKAEGVLQQEVFARSWENYQATGKAPTPALVQAFRSFKKWMLGIYESLTNSAIDVKMSDEVRDVFGRMLGADGRTVLDKMGNPLKVGDSVDGMEVVDILPDGRVKLESEDGDTSTANPKKLEKDMGTKAFSMGFDPNKYVAEQGVAKETIMSIKDKLAAIERGESVWVKPGAEGKAQANGENDFLISGATLSKAEVTYQGKALKKLDMGNNRAVYDLGDGRIMKMSTLKDAGWQEASAYDAAPSEIRDLLLPVLEKGQSGKYYYEIQEKVDTRLVNKDIAGLPEKLSEYMGKGDMSSASQWGRTSDGRVVIYDYKNWSNNDRAAAVPTRNISNAEVRKYQAAGLDAVMMNVDRDGKLLRAAVDDLKNAPVKLNDLMIEARSAAADVDWGRIEQVLNNMEISWRDGRGSYDSAARIYKNREFVDANMRGVLSDIEKVLRFRLESAQSKLSIWENSDGAKADALYQRNLKKVQDGQAQFEMFGERTVDGGRLTEEAAPQVDMQTEIMRLLADKDNHLADIQDALGYPASVHGNTPENPVNQAIMQLQASGRLEVAQGNWGDAKNPMVKGIAPLSLSTETSPQVSTLGGSEDVGTVGGMLPGMQAATGMMFDVQAGGGIRKMEAGKARSLFDVDPTRTAADSKGITLGVNDIVTDENGKRYNVKGANLRGKVVTADGKILEPASVTRVAKQDTFFQRAEPVDTPAFKNWFGDSKVVDENGSPLVVYHGTGANFQEFNTTKEGQFGKGAYFSNQPSYASGFAKFGKEPNVIPVYLSLKNPFVIETVLDIPSVSKLKKKGFDGIIRKEIGADGIEYIEYVAWSPEQIKSTANRGTFDPNNPNILYQAAEPTPKPEKPEPINLGGEQPFGSVQAAEGDSGLFHGEVMEEGWNTHVKPLMDAMREAALKQVSDPAARMDGVRDMSPEGQKMLRQYMKQVQNEMASTKLSAMRWGETKRDEALLNYGKRYGIDRYLEVAYPYQFFYTRSMGAWAARAIDKPAWFANYARIKRQQDRYERDIPERLRGKIKISMPWMPNWMGDAMYIDPLANLFTPANYLKPFERMTKDSTMQQQEAERILQEWSADNSVSATEAQQAAQTRSGTTWERAFAEAQIRRESEISNPMDFFNTMFGPAWYLTTPLNLLGLKTPISDGSPNKVTSTPALNTLRAIDTVTQGTWAQGAGDVLGALGRPEQWIQKKLGVPEFGEWGDYYIDRQLTNMAAEGVITAEDAQLAMMERKGENFDQARERVKMEMAMRVPTMAALMAGLTADNFAQGMGRMAITAGPSLFGSALLPEGEIEFRGLKPEWNEAWKKADAGDKQAIGDFFDEHPEYKAYLAKGKPPEERLRKFMVSQITDAYYNLGVTNRKQMKKEFGNLFNDALLDKETKDINAVPIETLVKWARMLNKKVPTVPETAKALEQPAPEPLFTYDKSVTDITDKYIQQRYEKFPNYYEVQQGYFNVPKSEQTKYLFEHPDLKKYWDWNDSWKEAYPNLEPIFKGQVFKEVDTSMWSPALVDYVEMYAMTGERLGKGAQKALEQQWIMAGSPYGDMQSWLDSQVVPAMLYGQ